ncbi:hypothetical protein [Bacillus sp. 1P06AnD]|uniref:hypothetical protein n=1 Tax=Bacillus sp. 1P06AnD TaxID=3132208 RepID=UPI00399FB29B
MKSYIIAGSIVSLALCLLMGCWMISHAIIEYAEVHAKAIANERPKTKVTSLMTEKEAASYLGISETELKLLGPNRNSTGSSESYLPYLQIGNKIYYSLPALNEWLLKDSSLTIFGE